MSLTLTPPLTRGEQEIREHDWTVEEFYRVAAEGRFKEPARLELIQGRIAEKMPQDPIHRSTRARLGNRLRAAFSGRLVVMDECPVHLAYDTELIADVIAAYGEEPDYNTRHPVAEDIAVLIEVANTSVISDLGEKAMHYAQSEVRDYWVVLVKESVIVRHRQPSPEGYQEVIRLTGEETLSPLAMPDAVWTIHELLGESNP